MTELRTRIDTRAVVLFVVLDLATFVLLYWLVMPAFSEVVDALDVTTATAIGWVLSAVRLVLVAVIAARSYRRRLGLRARGELVPTMVVAAAAAWVLQVLLGVAGRAVTGMPLWSALMLLDLLVWVGFALVAVLFVAPGEAEQMPLRYRAMTRDRGSLPAVLLLVLGAAVALGAAVGPTVPGPPHPTSTSVPSDPTTAN